ncbi:FAD-binding oxidoreductase [Saccharopolyspora taberi]|uniref:FAD-binding oxidoreductase n=2 Tax=Saccharopolyspora taberi TaxID=60895 RepID=A0ABN3VJE2_9PSEU
MGGVSRRTLLAGAASLSGSALVAGAATGAAQAAPTGPARSGAAEPAPVVVEGDIRYPALTRGQNQRFASRPESIHLPGTTDQAVGAVQDAVRAGKRISVRGGGHCYEDFVDHPEVQAIVDLSRMADIGYDAGMGAFYAGGGARLGDVYSTLFKGWGVTLPGGSCPSVGVGGHVPGGGYGNLSRRHGLIVDHLHAVEVVVVDAEGTARAVIATRDPADPNHDLWWAHTGGGGGSFGVVTRYFFRTPGATGEPSRLLPAPPSTLFVAWLRWPWDKLDERSFSRLVRNYGTWCEENSAPDSPYRGLMARLDPEARAAGQVLLSVQMDTSVPGAGKLLDDFIAAINDGVGVDVEFYQEKHELPFEQGTGWPGFAGGNPTERYKYKSSYHRKGLTDDQIGALYRVLAETDYDHPGYVLTIATHGCQVNAVAPDATAQPHRDSVLKLLWGTTWANPSEDAKHIDYHRNVYRSVYAGTGGVSVPNDVTDGCFINYADGDLADPEWNSSGVPWHELYFKGNYPRLQQAKAAYDPQDIFRHAQSIRLPGQQ